MKKQLLFIFSLFFLLQAAQAQEAPSEGFITTKDGVKLFYKIVGSGTETLVAVHGGPGNSLFSILPDLEPLAKNRRVIYYDQRGNGRSDLIKDEKNISITKHIADLEAVREHFKLDKMTLLGNSWGGLLLGFYAAAHPDRVERLIFHAPASPTRDLWMETNNEVARRMDRHSDEQKRRYDVVTDRESWTEGSDARALCREFYQLVLSVYAYNVESMKLFKGDVCSGPEEAIRRQMIVNGQIWRSLGNWNLLPKLGAVKAPVLVIHGVADVIPVKSSEAWTGAMPNARLLLIEKSGHMPQFEQPDIFFKAIETFLKGDFPAEAKKVQASLAEQSPDEGFITTPDGVRLFYKIVGEGKETLVAVNGGPGLSFTSILPDLEPLAKNRRVIYYDQRSTGRSDVIKDGEELSITKQVQDLEAVRAHFKLDKMTLLGNSWGGLLIGYYAAAHPDRVQRLIFHSPGPPSKSLQDDMDDEVQRRLKRHYTAEEIKRRSPLANPQTWLDAPDPRAVCREFYSTIVPVYIFNLESAKLFKGDVCSGSEENLRRQRFLVHHIWDSLGDDFNLLPSLGVVKAPALVIHGAADVIPVKSSEAWAAAMPNARLFLIEKSGHMPQFEQPEIFFKAVETFLKGDFPVDAKKIEKFK